jgi:hypothetical protein
MTDLSEGLLIGMQRELRLEHLRTTLGEETWEKLDHEGVRTIGDMALRTSERILKMASTLQLNEAVLQKFYTDCQAFVQES